MTQLDSAHDVIAALGGDREVAKMLERTQQAVRNWRYGRGIPPALRDYVDARLRRIGKKSAASAYSTYKTKPVKLPRRKAQRRQMQ
jgi:hypothetical protein